MLAAGLVGLLAVNLALLRRVFAPLARLSRTMREVDPLQPGSRVPLADADPEIADLTAAFNEMVERLESERRDNALRALAAQEGERRRIALELHDELGQALTAAMLRLDRADVEEAKEGLRAALEEVREIARRLRPEALDDLGLRNALRALVASVARDARLDYPGAVTALIRDYLARQETPADPLSPRELQVLKLIAEAYTSDRIALELSISRRTVDRHRENILAKLGMRDRVELTRYAIRRGLIDP